MGEGGVEELCGLEGPDGQSCKWSPPAGYRAEGWDCGCITSPSELIARLLSDN